MIPEIVNIAVFAKAPEAGVAKTRLIPALGARGAAQLQRYLTWRAVITAQQAAVGSVTLWCAPNPSHRFFRAMRKRSGVECRGQAAGDLGRRMLHAFQTHCGRGPLLLIGSDCPALGSDDLRLAAQMLRDGDDAVVFPAADGGYVLIGLRVPLPALFARVAWGTGSVMEETRARLRAAGATWREPRTLWDVDRPADLRRLATLWHEERQPMSTPGNDMPIGPDTDHERSATATSCRPGSFKALR